MQDEKGARQVEAGKANCGKHKTPHLWRHRWTIRGRLSPEEVLARNQMMDAQVCKTCGGKATRHFDYKYFYCSAHWVEGGLIAAAMKQGYRKTLGALRVKHRRASEAADKRRFNDQRYKLGRRFK